MTMMPLPIASIPLRLGGSSDAKSVEAISWKAFVAADRVPDQASPSHQPWDGHEDLAGTSASARSIHPGPWSGKKKPHAWRGLS
jgi:hypothetical protein